jgi:AraC-like DNA-binding protein
MAGLNAAGRGERAAEQHGAFAGHDRALGNDDDAARTDMEAARIDRVEFILLAGRRHERQRAALFDIDSMAASVLRKSGRVTVESLARASGVSRQHLARVFRERIGVGPKLYSRLARFQSVLSYSGVRASIDWALAALDMGFADQSHMIAECRRFSGLTPQSIADRDWFHPFIERAKLSSSIPPKRCEPK